MALVQKLCKAVKSVNVCPFLGLCFIFKKNYNGVIILVFQHDAPLPVFKVRTSLRASKTSRSLYSTLFPIRWAFTMPVLVQSFRVGREIHKSFAVSFLVKRIFCDWGGWEESFESLVSRTSSTTCLMSASCRVVKINLFILRYFICLNSANVKRVLACGNYWGSHKFI